MMLNRVASRFAKPLASKAAKKAIGMSAAMFGSTMSYMAYNRSFVRAETSADEALSHGGLDPQNFVPLRLTDIQPISPDTNIYYFQLSSPESTLNMPITSYVLAKAEIDGETVVRPYTPISELPGEMPLVIKTYPKGKMGNAFAKLKIGDTMNFKGPVKKYEYELNTYDRVTLIAGGSGITPMFQLMETILTNPDDRTKVHLLFANRSTDDILLKGLLDEFSFAFPEKFKITYIIDKPEPHWNGPTGYINSDLLSAVAGQPNPKHKVFVCMPPAGLEHVAGPKGPNYTQGPVGGLLKDLGYSEDQVYKF